MIWLVVISQFSCASPLSVQPGDLRCRLGQVLSLSLSLASTLAGGHCRLSRSTSSNFGGKLSVLCWPKEKHESFYIFIFDNIMALFTIIM